jgi:hypothetical protein
MGDGVRPHGGQEVVIHERPSIPGAGHHTALMAGHQVRRRTAMSEIGR